MSEVPPVSSTEQRPSIKSVLAAMELRFTSGNSIPVERAFIKSDEWDSVIAEIGRLDTALMVAWDYLNEIRHEAHDAETRVFNALEGRPTCQRTINVSGAEQAVGMPAVDPATSNAPSPGKRFAKSDNNSPSSGEK